MKIPTLYGEEQYSFITKWGNTGSEDGQFVKTFGVAVDSSGNNVYVADTSNNRIQVFSSATPSTSSSSTYTNSRLN
jgi:DNA-binding beta-propeller fold protein YncE